MEEIEELDSEIRLAEVEDFDKLTKISRICFPKELRWRAKKSHSRKWWENLVNSNNSEVWVCSIYEDIVGFIIFTINREKYEEVMENQHYSFFEALPIFIYSPIAFFRRVFLRLKLRKMREEPDAESSYDGSQISTYKKAKKMIKNCIPWCGPIAVLPGIRGKGISLRLMEHCCQRAKENGYKEIYTFALKKNMMSRVMIAITGFSVIDEAGYLIFYKKTL